MDQMVLGTQMWLNKTYTGRISPVTEDGITGWGTIRALTKALQLEIGVGADGLWGPGTEGRCPTISSNNGNKNIITILQCGLFCKGYDGGGIDGNYTARTSAGISNLKRDAGLSDIGGTATPLIFKVLLSSMDGFVLASSGDSNIRKIQQNLNRDYYKVIGLIPCNGVYSRDTNIALIKALQFEEGSTPDGIWGPGTQNKCPTIPGSKSNKRFVLLLQYSLYVNGIDPHGFDGLFGNGLSNAIKEFQSFCALPTDGYAGKQVWASLLVSTGDKNRKGTACDCAQTITAPRAASLKANGYKIVGRYLTGKFKMTPEEVQTIFANGIRLFPIFEVGGYENSYFTASQGTADAISAMEAAMRLGFGKETIIYFAVDYDAYGSNIPNNVMPYFSAIKNQFNASNPQNYRIGIYAPRNICTLVAQKGYSCSSFVCDMSSGFSGNLGYPLPKDWAFDQISTVTIGSGEGAIEIDNNICSNKYTGVSSVSPIKYKDINYVFYSANTKSGDGKHTFEEQAQIEAEKYERKYPGSKSILKPITSAKEFQKEWNAMGNGMNIQAVELIFHGTIVNPPPYGAGMLIMKDGSGVMVNDTFIILPQEPKSPPITWKIDETDIVISNLKTKTIDYLYFSACNSANPDVKNVAQAFEKVTNANTIIGWDGGTIFNYDKNEDEKGPSSSEKWEIVDKILGIPKDQYTWWKYVPKILTKPTRERLGKVKVK